MGKFYANQSIITVAPSGAEETTTVMEDTYKVEAPKELLLLVRLIAVLTAPKDALR